MRVYVDNHADLLNSARNFISKFFLHKIIWKHCATLIAPYTRKFYGVLPARVDFLQSIYKLPREKVELLVMGADDEKVNEVYTENVAQSIREKHGIKNDDFLIISGGKIDNNKLQTLLLMEAVNDINIPNLKLIVFGSVIPELKAKFNSLLSEKVKYIGWIPSDDTYKYFSASNLIVFPGLHSVYWEQAVGLGKPCVFRHMEGFTHIDLGGNCKFLYDDSVDEIKKVIFEIIDDYELYEQMVSIAMSKGMEVFSYNKIAQKSISKE